MTDPSNHSPKPAAYGAAIAERDVKQGNKGNRTLTILSISGALIVLVFAVIVAFHSRPTADTGNRDATARTVEAAKTPT